MLGIKRYKSAFPRLHKLRAARVRPERDPIDQKFPVEEDETFVGGATQGKERGVTDKVFVVGAVEVMPRRGSDKLATFHSQTIKGLGGSTLRNLTDLQQFVGTTRPTAEMQRKS
jgi:hypothetical protein